MTFKFPAYILSKRGGKRNRFTTFAKDLLLALIVSVLMLGIFFAAVLQESYKLTPVTAAEIQEAE